MITSPFVLSLRGAPILDVLEAAREIAWLPPRDPDVLTADVGPGDWVARFARSPVTASAAWGDPDDPDAFVSHRDGGVHFATRHDPSRDLVIAQLENIPFTVAVVDTLFTEWLLPPPGYRAPSFGDLFPPLGWACAFRGRGHDRLVSRRWLHHGPWRLHERAGDLSIVEFHDPAADPATALAQAKAGHLRMGITDTGGYIQSSFVYKMPPRGFYDAATGLMKVVVAGRPVLQRELLEACALRVDTRPVEPGPVRNVAYVFMDEEEAQKNLHELWLRGLECRAMRLGEEIRLDTEYAPVPLAPAWAAISAR